MKPITREELLRSEVYWTEHFRNTLFEALYKYMKQTGMSRKQLAKHLGVSKGYISQVLNGESNHRISKIVELSVLIGKAPYLYLKDLDKVVLEDKEKKSPFLNFEEMETSCYKSFHQITRRLEHHKNEYITNTYKIKSDNVVSKTISIENESFDDQNTEKRIILSKIA